MIGYKAVYGALSSGAANNYQVPGMYLSNVQVTTCTYRMYNWATKFYIYEPRRERIVFFVRYRKDRHQQAQYGRVY